MRFGLIQDALPEQTGERLREMVEEAVFAEKMGFDFYGLSEAHFTWFGTSAPDSLFGAIANRTTRLGLRYLCVPLLSFRHPLVVAERVATLDALSDGRVEFAGCRSNDRLALEAFGIDPSETRLQATEALEIIAGALGNDQFAHNGTVWRFPAVTVYPRPVQQPHPPLFMAATSLDGCRNAGALGVGVVSGNSLPGGWPHVEACAEAYRAAREERRPVARRDNDSFGVYAIRAHCAETTEAARAEARELALGTVDHIMKMWRRISSSAPDYAYMQDIDVVDDRREDLDYLVERAPYLSIGDPDFFVERCEQIRRLGGDEFVMAIDGLGHESHMRAIELIGTEVIPKVTSLV
jgi:alkanesulfonate monooxygenase SsuD/methylene tetrahydromethanopterin reductase-like flavin-dependent oxidoreductase (luciferase family)